MALFYKGKRLEKKESPHAARKGIALLLCAALSLSLLPGPVLAAFQPEEGETPVTEVEEATLLREPLDEDTLTRLRAGLLTTAEVNALIEKGLTVADVVGDSSGIMPTGIDPGTKGPVDLEYFNVVVNVPRETPADPVGFKSLPNTYTLNGSAPASLDLTGITAGAQAKVKDSAPDGTVISYETNPDGSYQYEQNYYPTLKSGTVDYEVTRLSYHDTTVYRFGWVEMTTTNGNGEKELHYHLYASSEPESGATSHFVLPDNAKITVEYSPVEYKVEYEIIGAGLPAGWDENQIFGANRPGTTTNQHVSTTVTIPAGYTARVYFLSKIGENWVNSEEKYPMDDATAAEGDKNPYGHYALGADPVYVAKDGAVEIDPREGPGYFSLTGTYQSGLVGSASSDIMVRVDLTKRTSFTISDVEWRKTHTGEDTTLQSAKIQTGTDSIVTDGGTASQNADGTYTYTWTFTTVEVKNQDWELRTLTINGDHVEMPLVKNPASNKDIVPDATKLPIKLGDGDGYVSVEPSVKVNRDGNSDKIYRTYTIKFSNITRDLYITTSAFEKCTTDELVVASLKGVELKVGDASYVQGQSVPYSSSYNIRFKPAAGYAWPVGGEIKDQITFKNRDGDDLTVNIVSEPDEAGWYTATLTGSSASGNNATAGVADFLTIEAERKTYQVHYMDGVATGTALQEDQEIIGLPTSVDGMPDTLDTNGGKFYDALTNKAIVVSSAIPVDNSSTTDKQRPAVFKYWVLTDKDGNPIDKNGDPITDYVTKDEVGNLTVDVSKLATYKGSYTADLSVISGYAFQQKDLNGNPTSNLYDIYLTALWEPAAQPFVYYITLNKIDDQGAQQKNIAQTKENGVNKYPILEPDTKKDTGIGAFVDRQTFAKVNETTIIFDPESTLAKNFLSNADYKWYKFDETGAYSGAAGVDINSDGITHGHIYGIQNYGVADVWLYYTLGGLTVKNEATGSGTFGYTITITLPQNDPDTTGNENEFFGSGSNYSIDYTGSGSGGPVTLTRSNNVYTGTFDLQAGASITFEDLPAGTEYKITQTTTPAKYALLKTDHEEEKRGAAPDRAYTGQYVINTLYSNTVTFTNGEAVASLNPATVTYNGEDQTENIISSLTVKLGDTAITNQYFDITVKDAGGKTVTAPTDAGTYKVTVTGKNGRTFTTDEVTFTIEPAEPAPAMFQISPQEFTYNRSSQTPTVTLEDPYKNPGTTAGDGNFTVKFYKADDVEESAPTDAGTYTVKISVTEEHNLKVKTDFVIGTFEIKPADIRNAAITLNPESASYTGNKIEHPTITVKMGNDTLTVEDGHYEVDWGEDDGHDYVNRGDYTITITGLGNYTGKVERTFTIADKPFSRDTVTGGHLYNEYIKIYDGKDWSTRMDKIIPELTYTDDEGSTTLTYGTNYTVQFRRDNATNADTYYIAITGLAPYSGSIGSTDSTAPDPVTFIIEEAPITDATVKLTTSNADYKDNNTDYATAIKSYVEASLKISGGFDGNLMAGTDFTIKITDSSNKNVTDSGVINAGNYTVTIEGQGNFTGTATMTATFTVNPVKPTKEMFDFTVPGNSTYGDNASKIATVNGLTNNYTNPDGDNFTIKYYKDGSTTALNGTPTDAGTYKVMVVVPEGGKNLNPGEVEIGSFTISQKPVNSITLEPLDSYVYDGEPKTPGILFDSLALPETDYTPEYRNNTDAGTAYVTVSPKSGGNYSFSQQTLNFTITPKLLNLTWIVPDATDLVYNGRGKNVTATADVFERDKSGVTVNVTGGSNQSNVGTYTANATVSGSNSHNYTFGKLSCQYSITKADPTAAMFTVTPPNHLVFDGRPKEVTWDMVSPYDNPGGNVTVEYYKEDGTKLDAPPIEVGTYTVKLVVDDKGLNLNATASGAPLENTTWTFTIQENEPIDLKDATVTLTPSSATYNGNQQKPAVAVTIDGQSLTEDTDYTIDWGTGDYTQAGTYTIIIKGKSPLYKGEKSVTFTINAAPSSSGGGSGGYIPTYPPNISEDNHGKTTTNPGAPRYGDKTTIWPEPNPGYTPGNVVVKDRNGNELNVTDNGDGSYSFIQPNGSVTIDVEYVCTQSDAYCPAGSFNDTSSKAWYHDGVHYCVENGLMGGIGSNLFAPNASTDRAMIATILWRIEGSPVVNSAMSFSDVADGQWYTEAIRWAASTGVVQGNGNNLFNPNTPITREQLAAMLYRYAAYKGIDVSVGTGVGLYDFDDASSSSSWAITALLWSVDNGIITGRNGTSLAPLGSSSRAEAATMLYRFCTEICD